MTPNANHTRCGKIIKTRGIKSKGILCISSVGLTLLASYNTLEKSILNTNDEIIETQLSL